MNEALFLVICSITGTIVNGSTLKSSDLLKNGTLLHLSKNDVTNVGFSKETPNPHNASHSTQLAFSTINESKISELDETVLVEHVDHSEHIHFLKKIHRTLTRSKDAIWATITLTFICVLLVLAVAQSQMWKDYHGPESQGVPLPNFNERVLFKDVMEHKVKSLKQIFQKHKKKDSSELESLLQPSEWDEESTSIPMS